MPSAAPARPTQTLPPCTSVLTWFFDAVRLVGEVNEATFARNAPQVDPGTDVPPGGRTPWGGDASLGEVTTEKSC